MPAHGAPAILPSRPASHPVPDADLHFLPPGAVLARLGAALDAVGVGLAVYDADGEARLHNAAHAAALDAREERLAEELAPLFGASSGDSAPYPLASIEGGVAVPLGAGLAAVVVGTGGALPPCEALRAAFGLSRREAEVALLLARRASTREVAAALHISPHTARHHAERVLHKLGVRTRAEVAAALLAPPHSPAGGPPGGDAL